MREIKFRGLRTDGKGWVYGDLNQNDIHHGVSILTNGVIKNSVIPETVGQFIGLVDKNGKGIFNGDVVQNIGDNGLKLSKFKIYYGDCCWMKEREDGECFEVSSTQKHLTVIGNIHENPELI